MGSDFNAEREARERIAGQKADIEEQFRQHKAGEAGAGGGPQYQDVRQERERAQHQEVRQERERALPPRQDLREHDVLPRQELRRENSVRGRINSYGRREHNEPAFENIPTTVNTRAMPTGEKTGPDATFPCPKCNREFRNTTLLTRHVNECLDRDY